MEKKIYTEDELIQMYQDGDITMLEMVKMHSEQWHEEFCQYCKGKGLEENEESAETFLDFKGQQLEKAMEEGNA